MFLILKKRKLINQVMMVCLMMIITAARITEIRITEIGMK